jgi:DNA-binding XRE family transcriptional regulator
MKELRAALDEKIARYKRVAASDMKTLGKMLERIEQRIQPLEISDSMTPHEILQLIAMHLSNLSSMNGLLGERYPVTEEEVLEMVELRDKLVQRWITALSPLVAFGEQRLYYLLRGFADPDSEDYIAMMRERVKETHRRLKAELDLPFAVILQAARDAANLSQTELAEKSGLTQSHISKLERGALEPQLNTLFSLAGALGVSTADLLPEPSHSQ